MALWSVTLAGTRETALASWRSDVRGVTSGLACDDASRLASWTGSMALTTKGVSTCYFTVRSRRFEQRGSAPSVSRRSRVTAGGPHLYGKHASGLTRMDLSLLL